MTNFKRNEKKNAKIAAPKNNLEKYKKEGNRIVSLLFIFPNLSRHCNQGIVSYSHSNPLYS
jgi:hypothetical protein